MVTHEAYQPELPRIYFKAEGYVGVDDKEFLEQFIEKLKDEGFDPDYLIYSGTDARKITKANGRIARPQAIFAMNEKGWVRAINQHHLTPAGYADGDEPCIALFDRQQLANAYSYNIHQDETDYRSTIEITDIVPAEALAELPLDDPVEEVVIHKDFPKASPIDALVGLVFLNLD